MASASPRATSRSRYDSAAPAALAASARRFSVGRRGFHPALDQSVVGAVPMAFRPARRTIATRIEPPSGSGPSSQRALFCARTARRGAARRARGPPGRARKRRRRTVDQQPGAIDEGSMPGDGLTVTRRCRHGLRGSSVDACRWGYQAPTSKPARGSAPPRRNQLDNRARTEAYRTSNSLRRRRVRPRSSFPPSSARTSHVGPRSTMTYRLPRVLQRVLETHGTFSAAD